MEVTSGGGMNKNRIREYREKNGFSQEDLAQLLGLDRSSIAKWESGENTPRTDRLIEMAKSFKCSIDELLGLKKV